MRPEPNCDIYVTEEEWGAFAGLLPAPVLKPVEAPLPVITQIHWELYR